MALRLSIVSGQLGAHGMKEFGPNGGTIGRSLECNWALPDTKRYLSSRHASIDFRSGSYYIIDTSTNGVYVNDAEQPVGRGKPQRLFAGDRVRIGEYEMSVEIDEDATAPLIDNHVDPVDIAQRVEAPEPTGNDLVDAYEITGVGIEMMLTDDELETLTPPARSKGAYFEIIDDDAGDARTPAARSSGHGSTENEPADTVRVLASRRKATPTVASPSAQAPGPAAAASAAATPAPRRAPAAAAVAPKTRGTKPAPSPSQAAPTTASAAGAAAMTAKTPTPPKRTAGPRPAAAAKAAPATEGSSATAAAAAAKSAPPALAPDSKRKGTPVQKPGAQSAPRTPAPADAPHHAAARPSLPPAAARAQSMPMPASGAQNLDAFFLGAGLSIRLPAPQIDAFLFRMGQTMNAMIVGITENLHVRAEQKSSLKLASTTNQPEEENNPLKVSASVEETFVNLLLRGSPAHLPAAEAVREAFDDVKLHQQLLLKAFRTALEAFVSRLDPDELEQKFTRGRTNVLVNAANRLKYWDFYKDLYDVAAHHPPGELPIQFLEDFAHAYEHELEQALGGTPGATEQRQAG